MKKIFKYVGLFLSVTLMGLATACNPTEELGSADLGLGIKVFFPTKVVAGQPMTINGSGFTEATEIVFPDGVVVKDFEVVSNDMIRVTAPAGIKSEGGKLIVRSSENEVESRIDLTVGKTVVSGYNKQPGELYTGGDLLTIYGKDLEFINKIELLDADGNPLILDQADFYRKGTSNVTIMIPAKNIYEGSFVGKIYTYDGRVIEMDEFAFEPVADDGHWEITKEVIWTNDGAKGAISWSSDYRFSSADASTGEEIYAIPMEIWERMKTETFYMTFAEPGAQIRVTTGWWSTTWTGNDIFVGDEKITENEDGTYTLAVNLAGDPILDVIDAQHLLFTGGGYMPIELFFQSEQWIPGGGPVITEVSVWKNDGSKGAISWSSDYRFSSADASTGEEIYAFPMDVWERLKTETFYMRFAEPGAQIRVTTGWWSTTWTGNDIFVGDEKITENEDGTYSLAINLAGDPILDVIDAQHLLFTGGGYTPLEIYFLEETYPQPAPSQTVFWENSGQGTISWSGDYRFGLDGHDGNNECAATFSQDVWDIIKGGTFYMVFDSADAQIRVTTGWWSTTWTGDDLFVGNEKITDNGDGTYTLKVELAGDPIVDSLDDQHLLFTGANYKVLKLYY